MRSWLYLILLLVSPQSYAVLFTPPPTDKSVELLGIIFGDSIGSIYLGGNVNPVLQSLMEHFNLIIVTLGLLVLSYVSIMSTINTAQEGSAMGKKWSAVWAPMRSLIGMAMMVPGPTTGYSTIQVTVMWIILQGIGIADQIWNLALDGMTSGTAAIGGTTTADPQQTTLRTSAESLATALLDIAVCMETFNKLALNADHKTSNDWLKTNSNQIRDFAIQTQSPEVTDITSTTKEINPAGGYYTTKKSTATGTIYYGVNNGNKDDMTACGSITISANTQAIENTNGGSQYDFLAINSDQQLNDAAQMLYEFKKQALSSMLLILKPLAQAIVDDNTSYDDKEQIKPSSSKPYPGGYAGTAVDAYVTIMSGLAVPNSATLDDSSNAARMAGISNGWITAGSFYFLLNKTAALGRLFVDRTNAPTYSKIYPCIEDTQCIGKGFSRGDGLTDYSTTLQKYSITDNDRITFTRNLAIANQYFNTDVDNPTSAASLGFDSSLAGSDAAAGAVLIGTGLIQPIMSSFENMLNSQNADPLVTFANFGRSMMIGAEAAWIALIAASMLITILAQMPFGAGTGGIAVAFAFLLTIVSVILSIIGVIWSIGASLAIYMPLIPYMMFTLAALGWMLIVVESIIAAPIIALGLVIPAGDELGKVESALALLANVFMRPTLMIFGFILAGRVYAGIVSLINFGMLDVFKTININTNFSSIVILFVYASFLISVTNTCFSLIYVLPDKILRWIGGPHEQTDVSALQQTKAASQQSSGAVGSGMGESGKMAAKKGQAAASQMGQKGGSPK